VVQSFSGSNVCGVLESQSPSAVEGFDFVILTFDFSMPTSLATLMLPFSVVS